MAIFTKESLSLLRQRIDLIEVLSPFARFSRSGGYFKACCPFHDEKTPSFVIQRGGTHYHCYGCGAHGDAIEFLMRFQKMTFTEAVEYLAGKFQIRLEQVEGDDKTAIIKKNLKDTLERASHWYHFFLLHTKEGEQALSYLYKRGIDLDFIRQFQLGYAPKDPYLFQKAMNKIGIKKQALIDAGLLHTSGRDFFSDRMMIPIRDPFGATIGFSARAFTEQYAGPKYVNSPETLVFKKSKVLFGLCECRRQIAKERKAIIVEGQIDAMRLIYNGFSITVAAQGTAFGETHVKELLHLGIKEVYLALDGDRAGREAALKIGDLFQREAIEVYVVKLPQNMDPDSILIEAGPQQWKHFLSKSIDYIIFLVEEVSSHYNTKSPAQKNRLITDLLERINQWQHPLLVHESIKRIAQLTNVPLSMLDGGDGSTSLKHHSKTSIEKVDADFVLETDLLRWIFLMGEIQEEIVLLAHKTLDADCFRHATCQRLFSLYMDAYREKKPRDLLALAIALENQEDQEYLSTMLHQKKVNREKASVLFKETLQKLLDRRWMQQREEIRQKIQSENCSHEEALQLAKCFDELKKKRPKIEEDS